MICMRTSLEWSRGKILETQQKPSVFAYFLYLECSYNLMQILKKILDSEVETGRADVNHWRRIFQRVEGVLEAS